MALPSFPQFSISSPEQAARQRAIAEALIGQAASPAQNVGQGLADVAAALSGSLINNKVGAAEEAGRLSAADALAGLGPNSDFSSVSQALANPWLSQPQASVASALLSQNLERNDPMYQLQRQKLEQEIAMMGQAQPIDPTSSIQNYEYLVSSGVDPAQAQTMAFGSGGTTINNMGNIPAGFEVIQDPATGATRMQPIPGGPAALEAEAAAAAAAAGDAQTDRYGNVVTEDIGRALEQIEKDPTFTTGVMGQILSQMGGTPANRVANLIETVESNVGFDRLQAMRESSPTGGALGSVTERELSLLTSAIGSLKQSNNDKDLAYNLRRVNKIYMDIIHGPGKWEPKQAPPTGVQTTTTGVEWSF